jgi:hypothetical protein
MEFTDSEREFLRAMRAITINDQGYEVYVGLSHEESEIYHDLAHRDDRGETMSAAEQKTFETLHARHEKTREDAETGKIAFR